MVEPSVGAGRIAIVRGLGGVRVGDHLGAPPARARARARWAPATLQSLVEPVDPTQRTALWAGLAGLAGLADEDPLVDLRIEEADGEATVSLHGEVQQEVVAALLEERYGVRARFAPLSVLCLERQSRMHQRFDKAMSSVGADFRLLAEVVVTAALRRGCWPSCRPGSVPALVRRLPDLTGGEGVLESTLDHHAPVPTGPGSPVPRRPRRGPDPSDRGAWFRARPR